jgi:hypothetical protein
MLIRKISIFTVFMLTLLLGIAGKTYANPNTDVDNAKTFMEGKKTRVEEEILILTKRQAAMSTLIGKWNDNQAQIKSGVQLTVAGVFGTTAAAIANYFAGGTLTMTTQAAGLLTLRQAVKTGMAISGSDDFLYQF